MADKSQYREIYTLGLWTVKPGKEDEFIEQWTLFAKWTRENFPAAKNAYLLQDEKNPLRLISFGPWENEISIQEWRQSSEFQSFVVKANELCHEFQPNTLKLISSAE